MIFTTTLQVIWAESYRTIYEDEAGNDLYYRMEDPFSPGRYNYYINPVGFMNTDGTFTPWQSGFETDSRYRYMLSSYSHDKAFDTERLPISAILNFRLSKEFGKVLEIAFMANNFLKITKSNAPLKSDTLKKNKMQLCLSQVQTPQKLFLKILKGQ